MAAMNIPDDSSEFLRLFVAHNVEFMVVGGHAVSYHGYPRFTHDVDVVVKPSPDNAERVVAALQAFGFGSLGLVPDDLLRDTTIVLGRPPYEIDIMTFLKGVDLDAALARRIWGRLDSTDVPFIGRDDLIANKLAVGRPQDLADISRLA